MNVETTFLDAIQAVPGETPGEKFRNISQLVSSVVKNGESVSTLIERQQLPALFSPYCEVEAARILKNHEMVAEALKSEDSLVIKKALSIRSFFNGSDERVTNPEYFAKNLLPFVSLNTRLKIIKNLSYYLRKVSLLAEEFFNLFLTLYGLEQASPLLLACSDEFTYKTAIEKNIILSCKLMKRLYRINPGLVIRYLKMARKNELLSTRNNLKISLRDYNNIIVKFIKIDLESFVEIVESYEDNHLNLSFSNKLAQLFMKKGKKYLMNKPMLYTKIIPLKVIDGNTMREIFPKLLPDKLQSFNSNEMLALLEFYPQEEKLSLLMESYTERYDKNLLENTDHVTPDILLLLSPEERIKQAKIKMANSSSNNNNYHTSFKYYWRCYETTNEVIPIFKEEITKASQMEDRCVLLGRMIYCCKVNNDDDMFLNILMYFNDRHKNEQSYAFGEFLSFLIEIYDNLFSLNEKHWEVINDIIQRMNVKGYIIGNSGWRNVTPVKLILEDFIHYKILHNLPIDQIIAMLADFNIEGEMECFNILEKYQEYEKKCLNAFIDYFLNKLEDPSPENKKLRDSSLSTAYDLLCSIYNYNSRHAKENKHLERRLSITNYPRLLDFIIKSIEQYKTIERGEYLSKQLKKQLKTHDKAVFETHFREDIADVKSGEALSLLKRKPESILKNWELYLSECVNCYSGYKNVVSFVKNVRWYNTIPVKWRVECEKNLKTNFFLNVLGILLDGPSFAQLVKPLMPKQKTLDIDSKDAKQDYSIVAQIPLVVNRVNPPPPLDILSSFFDGDYLSDGLRASQNLCRRTSVAKVIPFVINLTTQRVSVRKHGIRLHCMVATIEESCKLLLSQWTAEKNYSIRAVLFEKVYGIFLKDPSANTWFLLNNCICTLTRHDISCFDRVNLRDVPNQYVPLYVDVVLKSIEKIGVTTLTNSNIVRLLRAIDAPVCDLLSENLCMELIRKYFFDTDEDISTSASDFTLDSYILCHGNKRNMRLTSFQEFLTDSIRTKWNEPHPLSHFNHPVNKAIHYFVDRLTLSHSIKMIDLKLVESILGIFETVLEPKMDARSYLLLIYTKELLLSETMKDFGNRVGSRVDSLIGMFSELFIHYITQIMEEFLNSKLFDKREKQSVTAVFMEGLLEVENDCRYYMAANLLHLFSCKSFKTLYKVLVQKLVDYNNLAIRSIVNREIEIISEQRMCDYESE